MMFLAPFAVWARKIESKEEFFLAVKLHAMFIHSHELVIECCYLYCYAIRLTKLWRRRTEGLELVESPQSNIGLKTI